MMPDGDRFELVNGQLVERNMGAESSWVAGQIHSRINVFAMERNLGWAFPEGTSFQCFPDDAERVRKPDVSFVARGRLPNETPPRGHCRVPPDLAVEVVSPRDLYYEIDEKVQDYLDAGVKLIWIANPDRRTLRVHRLNGAGADLDESGIASGEDILPGFTCCVGEFFPPRRSVPSPS
jgi:Uma2 family endonuclease